MHPYPHTYTAAASGTSQGSVSVSSPRLPSLETAAPPEFDGPGGVWSPETLLCACLADCFILTFRAIARSARFEWTRLECRVEGILERVERVSQFTRYTTFAELVVPPGADEAKARELLERAEQGCLVANSLRGIRALQTRVIESDTSQERAVPG
ncbi:MAG TPA: OsmC family protein [Steroidobacteraceae bacterium]|nr:OsmC family protein [Steroidobacteraceae bacterium]